MTRLLIGYDGSESAHVAMTVAGALLPGAEARVVIVHPQPLTPEDGAMARIALPREVIREGIEKMARQTLELARATAEEGAARADAAGLRAAPGTLTGLRPWRELLDAGDAFDLLVCGTRGPGSLSRTAFGSTASSLVHHARRPLLIVPATATNLDGPLLAGYDGSSGARDALAFAAAHLPRRDVVVATAWSSPVRHTLRGHALLHSRMAAMHDFATGVDDLFHDVAEDEAAEGAEYARGLGLHAESRACESANGDWRALLACARSADAAALLVGTRGRGAVTAAVLGSVTSGLVHAGVLPVLVVPPSIDSAGASPP